MFLLHSLRTTLLISKVRKLNSLPGAYEWIHLAALSVASPTPAIIQERNWITEFRLLPKFREVQNFHRCWECGIAQGTFGSNLWGNPQRQVKPWWYKAPKATGPIPYDQKQLFSSTVSSGCWFFSEHFLWPHCFFFFFTGWKYTSNLIPLLVLSDIQQIFI